MKIKSFVFFSVFFLFGCQPRNSNLIEYSLSELSLELLVNHNGTKTKLSDINTNSEYTLDLSDEVIFSGLEPLINTKDKTASNLPTNSSSETSKPQTTDTKIFDKTPGRMEVFTSCLMKKEKYHHKKRFTKYQSHFYIIDLLPEEVLLEHQNKDPVSCSFLFIIRDKKENEYLYNLPSLPVLSVGKSASLKLLNDKNEETFGQLINKDTMNRFDLILQQDRIANKIKFLCVGETTITPFELKSEQSLVSPFKLLQSLKPNQLPSGKKKCRILTYGKNNSANGITASFQIDFETLKTPDAKVASLLNIKPELFIKDLSGKKTKLSKINATADSTLNLSDEIIFSDLDTFTGLKNTLQNKLPIMETSTNCLMNNKKYVTQKQLTNYQSLFYIVDLLPEEIFLEYKKSATVSCSFLFTIRDAEENERSYSLTQLPIFSIENNVGLKLLDDTNKEITGQSIKEDSMSRFSLITLHNKPVKKLKFLCEEIQQEIGFELDQNETLVFPFQFLQSLPENQLPSGKKKCRILTYGENNSVNGITALFQIDFETLKTPDVKAALLSNIKPELFVENLSGTKTKLSDINAAPDSTLNLSDKIIFSGLDLFNPKNNLIDKPVIMEVSINCLMKNKKYTNGKQLTNYQPLFQVVDLLPEEIFTEYKKNTPISCSFLFVIRDVEKNEHSYSLAPLPILSIENNVGLKLLDDTNQEFTGQSIKKDSINQFSLVALHNKAVKKLKFLCEKVQQKIGFELDQNETLVFPFQLLQSLPENQLPSDKKKCRILTYGENNSINGITTSFQIDFKDLKKRNLWMPQPQSLQIKIDFIPGKAISQYDRRKRKGKGRSNIIHTVSVFKIPGLFEQLPENFKEKDYESYKIKVNTECFSPLFSTDSNKHTIGESQKTYHLPLSESFPVMSVTPREAFQIYFPKNLEDILSETDPQSLRSDGKAPLKRKRRKQIVDYQEQVICSYHFQIQNERGELSSIGWIKNREVYWNPGSYGITFNTERAEKGFPLLLNQALNDSIQVEFLFLRNLASPTFQFLPKDFALPDSMVFSCGGRRFHPNDYNPNFKTSYEESFALNEVPLSIPLSWFITKKGFDTYLENNQFIKCRIVLYRKGVLQYFSQDIKFVHLNRQFLRELNNLSKTDTFWNFETLSFLLFWL